MSFTLNHIVLLLIALAIGIILGLMISGRGKYRRLWRDEQAVHRAAIKDRDARLDAADRRIVELERHPTVSPLAPTVNPAVSPVAVTDRAVLQDDLRQINGINKAQEIALHEIGYQRFGQFAALDTEQEAAIESRLGLNPGTIAREQWREQARMLDDNRNGGLSRRVTTPV